MQSYLAYAVWAMLAGATVPVMAILNAGLSRSLGGSPLATCTMMVVALMTSLMLVIAVRPPLPAFASLEVPHQFLIGGVIVAFYVFSVTSSRRGSGWPTRSCS